MCILQGSKSAFQFELKNERSPQLNATNLAEKERKNPPPEEESSPSRRVVRYRQEPKREDRAYQAMNVDLSAVNGAAVLMAAAGLRIAGSPESQGVRLWGQLAFGELQEGRNASDPVRNTIRDMLFIDGRLYGYDMARHSLAELQPGDDYELREKVIPNPIIED